MPRFVIFPTFIGLLTCLLSWPHCAGFSTASYRTSHRVPSQRHASDGDGYVALGRRELLDNLARRAALAAAAAAVALPGPPARALDFAAFESGEISKDADRAAPKLSDDEALCKYGAPGKAMGAACERAKMKPNLPSVVDASGQVDRGEYLRCKTEYPIVDGQYVKTRVCKPSKDWGADEAK